MARQRKKIEYSYLLKQDYKPYQMVKVSGEDQELISYPYPKDPDKNDNEAWICIRDKDDPSTLQHVPLSAVELIPKGKKRP